MIHHTILAPYAIFGEDYKFPEVIQCKYLGQNVEAYKVSNNSAIISRVISTDPYVYLNPQLQPGCKLMLDELNR